MYTEIVRRTTGGAMTATLFYRKQTVSIRYRPDLD